jgi:hypothetical protein
MWFLVSYDIDQGHDAVKAQCIRAGFSQYFRKPDGSRKQLPNTTLIVEASNAEEAVNKFKEQVRSVSLSGLMALTSQTIKIEKVVGVGYTEVCIEENEVSDRSMLAGLLRRKN